MIIDAFYTVGIGFLLGIPLLVLALLLVRIRRK